MVTDAQTQEHRAFYAGMLKQLEKVSLPEAEDNDTRTGNWQRVIRIVKHIEELRERCSKEAS